jgi:hypothetical protein
MKNLNNEEIFCVFNFYFDRIFCSNTNSYRRNCNELIRKTLHCINQEYPNKTAHVINNEIDVKLTPKELHPSFYGCFDWHSSVHGHWMLVKLLKDKPFLKIKKKLLIF